MEYFYKNKRKKLLFNMYFSSEKNNRNKILFIYK